MPRLSRRILGLFVLATLTGCVVQPPPARPAPPPVPSAAAIDQRQRNLEHRIEQGFRSGHITGDERQLLRRMADDARREERRYMNDGQLSIEERRALSVRLDQLAREVDRHMHDAHRR